MLENDTGIWASNPVCCIEQVLSGRNRLLAGLLLPRVIKRVAQESWLPSEALSRWAEMCGQREPFSGLVGTGPGVVGLVVDNGRNVAHVVPLAVRPEEGAWSVDTVLPFSPDQLTTLLTRVLSESGQPLARSVPERLAFSIDTPYSRRSHGRSMDVAGLLAIVREANEHPSGLDRACAVVEPNSDGTLRTVGGARLKLEGFQRECGQGTLLVRHRQDTESAAFDSSFDDVVPVERLADLGSALHQRNWLRVFLQACPLSAGHLKTAEAQLHHLKDVEHRFEQALELSRRILECGFDHTTSAEAVSSVQQTIADLHRNMGYYSAAEAARKDYDAGLRSAIASYDEQARRAVTLAASLFTPHRFQDVIDLLNPWAERLVQEPRLVEPATRVRIWNTLARAESIVGSPHWEQRFRQSAELQEQVAPGDLPRTWGYLAGALLRQGRVKEAAPLVDKMSSHPAPGRFTLWTARYLRAEVQRHGGGRSPENDDALAASDSGQIVFPHAIYLQSSARQSGRSQSDSVDRFRLAKDLFLRDGGTSPHENLRHFQAGLMSLAEAAWLDDRGKWNAARDGLAGHLSPNPDRQLADFYEPQFAELDSTPNQQVATAFLDRVVYV